VLFTFEIGHPILITMKEKNTNKLSVIHLVLLGLLLTAGCFPTENNTDASSNDVQTSDDSTDTESSSNSDSTTEELIDPSNSVANETSIDDSLNLGNSPETTIKVDSPPLWNEAIWNSTETVWQ